MPVSKVLKNSMEKKEKRIITLEEKIKHFENKFSEVKNLETKLNDSWHVIVGTNFGSFVTYEREAIILFWLEHIGFLLFKHG